MKTPWNLIIPDKKIQANLNEKLRKTVRPFLCTTIVMCLIVFFSLLIHNHFFWKEQWTEYLDFLVSTILFLLSIMGFLVL